MRYNIHGYRQDKAIEFGLDNDELLILRHFEDFTNSGKMDSFYKDGYMFYWVNYDTFLKNLPILKIKKDRLGDCMIHNLGVKPIDFENQIQNCSEATAKRLKNRKYLGVLINETVRNKEVGVRSYFAFTKKFYDLKLPITNNDYEISTLPVPISEGSDTNTGTLPVPISEGIPYQYGNKDSSIRDSTIRDSTIRDTTKEDVKLVSKYVEQTLGIIGPNNMLDLLSFIEDGVEANLIIRAIDEAVGNGKRTYRYVKGILNNWLNDGIKNSAQLTEHIKNKNKKTYNNSINQNDCNYNYLGVNSDGKCSTDNDSKYEMDRGTKEKMDKRIEECGIDWSKY